MGDKATWGEMERRERGAVWDMMCEPDHDYAENAKNQ